MSLDNSEKEANIAVSIVTIIAIISGGVFGLVEYLEYKKESKIKNTIDLVTRYHSGHVLKSKLETDKVWNDMYPIMTEIFKTDKTSEAYEGFILTIIEKNNLTSSVSIVMGLFDETVVCLESEICDKSTIDNYFLKSGKSFFNKYYPFVCDQRNKWNDVTIWKNVQKYYNPDSMGKICS